MKVQEGRPISVPSGFESAHAASLPGYVDVHVPRHSAANDQRHPKCSCRRRRRAVSLAHPPAPEPPCVLKADRRAGDGLGSGRTPGKASAAGTRRRARVRSAERTRSHQMASRVPPTRGPQSWSTGSSAAQSAHTQDWTEACRRPSAPPGSWPLAG